MLPGYDGRNRTFFLVNYEGTRIDRGATELLHGADAASSWRDASARRSSIRPPARRSRTTPFRSRGSRGSRSWRSGTTGSPRRTSSAAQGNYQAVRTFPQVQDQFTIRGDQDLGRSSAGCSSAIRTHLREHDRGRTSSMPATGCSCRTRRTGRSRTAGRSGTRSSTSSGSAAWTPAPTRRASPARRRTWTSSGVPGMFTGIPDDQRECPSIGDDRVLGHRRRGQRLHREQSADVGHQQHDHLGQRAATR